VRHNRSFRGILLATSFLAPLLLSETASGGYLELSSTIDEVIRRQSLGAEAVYFGGQGILEDGETSVSPYAFFGGYGQDGIMTGAGASVQTEALLPFGVGVGGGVTDADVFSWSVGLNAHKKVLRSTWYTLLVQGAVVYQRVDEDHDYAIWLNPAVWPDTPQDLILFDEFSWYTGYLHAVLEARWQVAKSLAVKPLIGIGWLAARYSYTGNECDYGCLEPGAGTSGDGTVYGTTFGFGLSLDFGSLRLFGGIKTADGDAILPVSLSIVF
jgi:hypothetical protein